MRTCGDLEWVVTVVITVLFERVDPSYEPALSAYESNINAAILTVV